GQGAADAGEEGGPPEGLFLGRRVLLPANPLLARPEPLGRQLLAEFVGGAAQLVLLPEELFLQQLPLGLEVLPLPLEILLPLPGFRELVLGKLGRFRQFGRLPAQLLFHAVPFLALPVVVAPRGLA